MSEHALVQTRVVDAHTEVIQRRSIAGDPKGPSHGQIRRTPFLFGIGFIEFAQFRVVPSGLRPVFGAFEERTSLREFVAHSFAVELGISSSHACARRSASEPYPKQCSSVITEEEIDDVVNFLRFLRAPPKPRTVNTAGARLFEDFGCGRCHVKFLTTVDTAPQALRNKTVAVYSDLQLHGLGTAPSVKTAPLWGVNSFGPPYWHDASASLSEAIASHHGEASNARSAFEAASQLDRENLLAFLKSL